MRTLILPLLAVSALAAGLDAQRRRDPGPPPKLEHGTWENETFESDALKREVDYGIYLPASYAEEKDRRYPLIVWLHGMWEDHERFNRRGGSATLDAMIGRKEVPELILACPNGGRSSFYINGKSSGRNEDMVVEDFMAHLEATYRLEKGREHRAIMGVSMGGMAALKIALRHPDLFSVVATHSAAIFPPDPENLSPRFKQALEGRWARRMGLEQTFGDPWDKEIWQSNNPLYLVHTMPAATISRLRIYFDAGTRDRYNFDESNQALHAALDEREIRHTWELVKDGGHSWGDGLAQRSLPGSLRFVAASWSASAGLEGLLQSAGGKAGKRGPDRH